ncbi:MAG: putative toxin-antitoxin system toxin component, PIN family, partial [Bacteroidaceae bacterium]|nr:putative toxin-antitoxin system toxin component, PIN family [Bacteroidaceae bacterium]
YYPVWKSFIAGEYDLCVSSEILEEYEEVIGRLMSPLAAKIVVEAILKTPNTRRLDPHFRFRLIEKDPDDNKFVDCAISAGADYIVSEDTHFRVLESISFPTVYVIRLDDFMKEISQ